MRILVACEFSGVVRDAFLAKGHDAVSCDLLPTISKGPHIQDNVLRHLAASWDLMIAHPPCTYLANSGARWLYKRGTKEVDQVRWSLMEEAVEFFRLLLEADIERIAIENPIMHGHAKKLIGISQSQIIQPWQFGHGETKATCLWLKTLPKLTPTNIVSGREARIHKLPPSADRGLLRSITYQGIAYAMAEQWGIL